MVGDTKFGGETRWRCFIEPPGGRVNVRPGGSAPAREIHANVREATAEICVDLSQKFPKPLGDDAVRAADVVVTMGCGDASPVYPGRRYLDWDLPTRRGSR